MSKMVMVTSTTILIGTKEAEEVCVTLPMGKFYLERHEIAKLCKLIVQFAKDLRP